MNLYDREQEIYGKKHFKHDAGFDGIVTLTGGKRVGVKSVSADYTVLDNDGYEYILVTTSTTNRTITLPTAADNTGRLITIRKVDSGSGKVTVDGEGSETIDGVTTLDILSQYDWMTVLCDGTAWHFVAGTQIKSAGYTHQGNWVGNSLTPAKVWDIGTFTAPFAGVLVVTVTTNVIVTATNTAWIRVWNNGAAKGDYVGYLASALDSGAAISVRFACVAGSNDLDLYAHVNGGSVTSGYYKTVSVIWHR